MRSRVEVIVVASTQTALATKQATRTVPIVNASHPPRTREALATARALKLHVHVIEARSRDEIADAFRTISYGLREAPLAGGLMSYGVNLGELFRRAAGYVDKIEAPVRKTLGLTIPPSLLLRADQVIE